MEKQKYYDLEKSMEAALNRKQKQIDNYCQENKDVEVKYNNARQEAVVLTGEVKTKTVKLV